jgi:hypothetical protein
MSSNIFEYFLIFNQKDWLINCFTDFKTAKIIYLLIETLILPVQEAKIGLSDFF